MLKKMLPSLSSVGASGASKVPAAAALFIVFLSPADARKIFRSLRCQLLSASQPFANRTLVVSAKGGVSLPSSGVSETGFRLVLAWSGRGGRDRTGCRCRTVCGSDRRSSTTLADFDSRFDGESHCSLTAQDVRR